MQRPASRTQSGCKTTARAPPCLSGCWLPRALTRGLRRRRTLPDRGSVARVRVPNRRGKGECQVEIFQPRLQLIAEPDGEYTLHAVTITPNSGYSAGRARPGAPPNVRLIPEVFPVLLEIRARRGPALQVL